MKNPKILVTSAAGRTGAPASAPSAPFKVVTRQTATA